MKADSFGSCPRLISDRVRVTLTAALAGEAEAIAATIMQRPVRSRTVPEGALLLVQLIQKGSHSDALVERLVTAFEELERRNVGVTISLEREQWYADEDRDAARELQLSHQIDRSILLRTFAHCVTTLAHNPTRAHFVNISGNLLRHPDIKGVLSGKGGPTCALFK